MGVLVTRGPAGWQEVICTRPGSYYCYSFLYGSGKTSRFWFYTIMYIWLRMCWEVISNRWHVKGCKAVAEGK